ncbi:MAG: M48 family metallopeptidase [Clostridia bacterium]|nr:M48 family metallopeptidase [Clostridia bacterium]
MKSGKIPVRFLAREDCFRLLRDPRGRRLLTAPRALGKEHADAFLRGWAEAEALPLREADGGRLLSLAEREAGPMAAALAVAVPRLALTGGRHVWGLCGTKTGVVRLHRDLSRMPDSVPAEVLLHELCHLREPAHSPAFWRLMDEHMPDWPVREGVLRCLGEKIHAGRNCSASTDGTC